MEDGRIALPAEVGADLGLHHGDAVLVVIEPSISGHVMLQPGASVTERTFGVSPRGKRSIDAQEMRQIFEAAVTDETMRELLPDGNDDRP